MGTYDARELDDRGVDAEDFVDDGIEIGKNV
jgi:hypothetical protein